MLIGRSTAVLLPIAKKTKPPPSHSPCFPTMRRDRVPKPVAINTSPPRGHMFLLLPRYPYPSPPPPAPSTAGAAPSRNHTVPVPIEAPPPPSSSSPLRVCLRAVGQASGRPASSVFPWLPFGDRSSGFIPQAKWFVSPCCTGTSFAHAVWLFLWDFWWFMCGMSGGFFVCR